MSALIIVLIFLLSFLFRIYILVFLPLRPLVAESILFFDLLNKPLLISSSIGIFLGLVNLALIMLIGKRLIKSEIWFIPSLIYAISPWAGYLEVGGSLYIPILTCLLLIFTSLKLFKSNKLSLILMTVTSLIMIYTSVLMWLMMPVFIFSIFKLGFINFKTFRIYAILVLIFSLPLFLSTFANLTGLKNIFSNQASVFAEVGLINTVNTFRGETAQTNFAIIGKFVENRYFYLSQHFIFNLLKHLSPVAYFTPEFKMFDFSFSPPILVGFLLPFLFGLRSIFDLIIKNRWMILTIFALIIPSIFSKNSPDLNRLVLIAPGIFILIGFGFKDLLAKKTFLYKALLFLTFIIILTQTMTVLSDIYFRESIRLYRD